MHSIDEHGMPAGGILRRLPASSAIRASGWLIFLAAGMVATAVYLLIPSQNVQDVVYQVPGTLAVGAIVAGVAIHRPSNARPWLLMAAGLLLTTAGDWIWVAYDFTAGDLQPFPSVADLFYVIGQIFILGSVVWLAKGRIPGGDRAGLLDAAIISVGAALLSWVFIMAPTAADSTESSLTMAVALAYPVLDLAALAVTVRLLLAPGRRTPTLWLVIAALVGYLAADFTFALLALDDGYHVGMVIDAGWLLAAFCWGAAALHPSMADVSAPVESAEAHLGGRRLALLAGASLMAPAVLLVQWARGGALDVPVIAAGSVVLFLLVIARLSGVVGELRLALNRRHILEEELQRRALSDPLTGLANRTLFNDRLRHSLARREGAVSVLYLDLDDFKRVNDAYGHAMGDSVLRSVATALERSIRSEDTAARLGGDEFAILVEHPEAASDTQRLADRLQAAIRECAAQVEPDFTMGASIGITSGLCGVADPGALLREADIAMYVAKGQGKGRAMVFEPAKHAEVMRSLALRAELEHAIRDQQFELHYQPIVDLATGAAVGAEALVRWRHPSRGLLPPLDFIPMAESTGVIPLLGAWIVREACQTAARWARRPAADPDWFVSVNLSGLQLVAPEFEETIRGALAESGLEPHRLLLELTESSRLDHAAATGVIGRLREMGVRLGLDDFGTGYASLIQLARVPFDMVKIDQGFVMSVHEEAATTARADSLIRGVVDMASHLDMVVVAEGIETGDQLARLRALGCQYGQGFFFSRPVPAAQLARQLAAQGRARARRTRPRVP